MLTIGQSSRDVKCFFYFPLGLDISIISELRNLEDFRNFVKLIFYFEEKYKGIGDKVFGIKSNQVYHPGIRRVKSKIYVSI